MSNENAKFTMKLNEFKNFDNWFLESYPIGLNQLKAPDFLTGELKEEVKPIDKTDAINANLDEEKETVIDFLDLVYAKFENIATAQTEYQKVTGKSTDQMWISKDLSDVLLTCPNNFDGDRYAYISRGLVVNDESGHLFVNSFTTSLLKAYQYIVACQKKLKSENDESLVKKYKDYIDEVEQEISSLVYRAISLFKPSVVAENLNAVFCTVHELYKDNTLLNDASEERFRRSFIPYLEDLLIRENFFYDQGEIGKDEPYVFKILGKNIPKNSLEILEDVYGWKEKLTVTFPLYAKQNLYKKYITDIFIAIVFHNKDALKYNPEVEKNEVQESARYLRQHAMEWIKSKTKDIDTGVVTERKTSEPRVFTYLEISRIVISYYDYLIYNCGNIAEKISKFDEAIAKAKAELEVEGLSEESKAVYEDQIKNTESAKKNFMTTKSLCAFFIQEMCSTEAICYKAFPLETVLYIVSKGTYDDSSADDSNSVVSSLFTKRDFHPMGQRSINPYYMHYLEGDISSEEVKLLASYMASITNLSMKSIVACSSARLTRDLFTGIISTKNNYAIVKASEKENLTNRLLELKGCVENFLKELKSDKNDTTYEDEFGSHLKEIVENSESVKDLIFKDNISEEEGEKISSFVTSVETVVSRGKEFCNKYAKQKEKPSKIDSDFVYIVYYAENVKAHIETFKKYRDSYFNIMGQYTMIVTNLTNPLFGSEFRDNKEPEKNLWPKTQSYERVVEEPTPVTKEQAEWQYMMHLKPGDIEKGNYGGSRFTNSKACD